MDQKAIATGGMVTGSLVIFCGVMVSPVAIGMLLSFPHPIWWLGLVMVGSCGLMIYGGIQSIRKAKKQEWQAKEELERLQSEVAGIKSTGVPVQKTVVEATQVNSEVLAYWMFTAEEWKQFLALEKKRRKSSTSYEAAAIVILGTIGLMSMRDASLWMALLVSIVIAAIVSWLRWVLTMNSFGNVLPKNEVTITDQSILINDKLNPYRSENYWLDKIQILDGDPDVLEITYAWNTRKGNTFDEMRVPIPKGKRDEALNVINKILPPQS